MPSVVAYAYDADYHCESCMLAYARSVPYKDYVWGEYDSEDHRYAEHGMLHMMPLVEDEIIRDSENNPIHPVFTIDEWWEPSFDGPQFLVCSDCGEVLDSTGEEEG